ILPVITLNGIITYNIIEGPVDGEQFMCFLREHVLPFTNPYPGTHSMIIMDNCCIHHSEAIHTLIE
ncbi:hypothetical protein PISMIDRAFT_72582, partial [Pisolithus microcarpus 441]